MMLPPLAPVPSARIRLTLDRDEWHACLEAWLTLVELYLQTPDSVANDVESPAAFLTSYYRERALLTSEDVSFSSATAKALHTSCFLLTEQLLLGQSSSSLASLPFLATFCRAYIRSAAMTRLLSSLWKLKQKNYLPALQVMKAELVKAMDSVDIPQIRHRLETLAPIMHASADMAAYFMTGSDFLDAATSTYQRTEDQILRKELTTTVCLGLLSLNRIEPRNVSLLSDHLYSLKAQAKSGPSLLADLVTNTSLLSKLRQTLSGKAADRVFKVLDELETYRLQSIARSKSKHRRSVGTAKNVRDVNNGEMHIHRMSLVTQIQDLFPDLDAGFILRLLDEYHDDVEQATAHLLEDSLPGHLREMDRAEPAPPYRNHLQEGVEQLVPRSTPPLTPQSHIPDRRNVFDDDEFDRLEVDAARLHIGKQNRDIASQPSNKAAILSALAAFDSDDDERDDTYDVEDVGGTIDNTNPEPGAVAKEANDEIDNALFATYISNPELFGRTFDVRRGQARAALKAETGMTDEAIEGWAIMLQRDPKKLKRLESKMSTFDGKQNIIDRTAYRDSPGATETEDSDARGSGPEGRDNVRSRKRGTPGRIGASSRGGGTGSDVNTSQAHKRKEANKSSRANHNRRNQRAKKLARGGFAG